MVTNTVAKILTFFQIYKKWKDFLSIFSSFASVVNAF